MPVNKSQVIRKRWSLIGGLVGGIILDLMFHFIKSQDTTTPATPTRHYSIFFGNMAHWPRYMRGYWPLDLAEICVCFGLVFYLLLSVGNSTTRNTDDQITVRFVLGYGLGVFLAGGSLCGLIMSGMFGWYSGLEAFLVAGAFFAALIGILLGAVSLIFAVGPKLAALVYQAWNRWYYLRPLQFLSRTASYLNADDIADPQQPEP